MANRQSLQVRAGTGPVRRIGALGIRFLRDPQFRNVTMDMLNKQTRDRSERFEVESDELTFDVSWLAGKRIYFIGGCEFSRVGISLTGLGAEIYHTFEEGAATDPLLELSRPDSAFWAFGADVLVVSQASQAGSVLQRMQWDPLSATKESQESDLAMLREQLRQTILAARKVHTGPIFLMTHPLAYRPALGINEHLSFPGCYSLAELLRLQELQIYELAREFEHVVVINVDLDSEPMGNEANYETERANGFYEHFTDTGTKRMVDALLRRLYALEPGARRIKCVALDLDNTMWNGVLREDGPDGVRPRGCYQSVMRMLAARGILITIVSKNDVEEEQFLPVLLGQELYDTLSATKLSWGAKSASIAELAKELNIGIDSIAFFDDNERERAEVELNAPGVLVLSDADIAGSLAMPEFQPLGAVTADGARRGERYKTAAARSEAAADAESGDLEGFLLQSGLKLTVRPPVAGELARAAEMAARTNQLNATLARTDLPTLQGWVADGYLVRVAELEDRFGDYGLIGVAVSGRDGADHRLHELAISCRAMGRSVEAALIGAIADAAADEGADQVVLPFTRGSRNAELERILRGIGFEEAGTEGDLVNLVLPVGTDIEIPAWLALETS
ncbi:MAG: FkbH protein [Ilumatobacteraceae bacterium]|nr:FkbH protein [Ilumatobacteraceae bacterium]